MELLKVLKEEAVKTVTRSSILLIIGLVGYLLSILPFEILLDLILKLESSIESKPLEYTLVASLLANIFLISLLIFRKFRIRVEKGKPTLISGFGILWDKEKKPYCPTCKEKLNPCFWLKFKLSKRSLKCVKCKTEFKLSISIKKAKNFLE